MEDATITKETEEQPMYQQGRYPSVINTDDLVFEMGKQLVGNLNKEKLLDKLLDKSRTVEVAITEASKIKAAAEKKAESLEISNRQYVENNQKLDAELVRMRKECEDLKRSVQEVVKESELKMISLSSKHKKSLAGLENLLDEKEEELQKLKKKRVSRKRG